MVTASTHSLSLTASIRQSYTAKQKNRKLSCKNVGWTRQLGECVLGSDDASLTRPPHSGITSGSTLPNSSAWSNREEFSRVNFTFKVRRERRSRRRSEHWRCGATNELGSFDQEISPAARRWPGKDGHSGSLVEHRKQRRIPPHTGRPAKMLEMKLGEIARGSAYTGFQPLPFDGANGANIVSELAHIDRVKGTLLEGCTSALPTATKWGFVAGAMTAGTLFSTMYSSAVAETMASADGPPLDTVGTTLISNRLQSHAEIKRGGENLAHLKVPESRLEELAMPMSQWKSHGVDEHTLIDLKTRMEDQGGGNLLLSEDANGGLIVPVLYPSAAPLTNDSVFSRGSGIRSANETRIAESGGHILSLRNFAAGNSGTIPVSDRVVAAGWSIGSVASVSALPPVETTVPGVSLFTRLIMHFGGGGVAGAMGATLVYPLDTIKTRMQAQSNKAKKGEFYKNEWDCLLQMVSKEGPGSLYNGLLAQLVGIAPEKAMKLTVNDVLMEMLESEMPGVRDWALELVAGGGGGFCQVVFTNPMEIVKVRLQTQARDARQKTSWDVIKELGLQGLYSGSSVTLVRDVPSTAIFFAIYTLIRHMYPDQSFMAGFVAAIPATVLVTPFDVVKTRIQMEQDNQEAPENAYACFKNIMRNEGVGALFKGSLARVLKTSPQFGLTLMLYNILSSASLLDTAMGFLTQHLYMLEASTENISA